MSARPARTTHDRVPQGGAAPPDPPDIVAVPLRHGERVAIRQWAYDRAARCRAKMCTAPMPGYWHEQARSAERVALAMDATL